MRDEIAGVIEQIPFTVDIVTRLSSTYDEEAIRSHVSQLLVAILDLLQECLSWLTKHPTRKVVSAIVKGKGHSAALMEKMAQLTRLQKSINKTAMVGLHEVAGETREMMIEMLCKNNESKRNFLIHCQDIFESHGGHRCTTYVQVLQPDVWIYQRRGSP